MSNDDTQLLEVDPDVLNAVFPSSDSPEMTEVVAWDREDQWLANGEHEANDRLATRVQELEASLLRWLPMTERSPTVPGTYVVRVFWQGAGVQLLQLPEGGLNPHWARVTHWLGPIPPLDV